MVEIPTTQTQRRLAEILHDLDGCQPSPFGVCGRSDWYMTQAGLVLGKLMEPISTEMFPAVRADERDKVAYHITAELVCCDIHARLEAEAAKGHWDEVKHEYVMPESWHDLKRSSDHHPICRYGGWAASLAYHEWEGEPYGDWWKPWLVDDKIEAPQAPGEAQ